MNKLMLEGKCQYHFPFKHLNSLFKFPATKNIKILAEPSGCPENFARDVIIFGIKVKNHKTQLS